MNIQKSTSSNRKKFIVAGIVVVLLVGGVFAYMNLTSKTPGTTTDSTDYSPPTSEQTMQGEETKKQVVEDDLSSKDNSTDKPAKGFSQQITTVQQTDGVFYVRNEITGVYQTGTCTLTVSKGSKTITKTSGVQALAKTSTCKGFNIPMSELSSGTWSVLLTVRINDMTADDSTEVSL